MLWRSGAGAGDCAGLRGGVAAARPSGRPPGARCQGGTHGEPGPVRTRLIGYREAITNGAGAMKPPSFDYAAPNSVTEAVALLQQHEGDAKVLAGGQSLMPLLNMRLARP